MFVATGLAGRAWTLPDGFTPTWHSPAARIDEVARVILGGEPG